MRLGCVTGRRRIATEDVYLKLARLEVGWIDAVANTAKMIDRESSRDRAIVQFISEPVDIDRTVAAVPSPILRTRPQPAGVGLAYPRPKRLRGNGHTA